jgi:hypothetical protein
VRPGIRMSVLSITLVVGMMLAAGTAAENHFQPGPASEYAHQSAFGITIGAKPFDSRALTTEAFGKKAALLKYGILPVLVVIDNKGNEAVDLRSINVDLIGAGGRHFSALRPEDVHYLAKGGHRSTVNPLPIPLPAKKNPLDAPEIETRAFRAEFVPPGDSVSGFFYFEAKLEPGDRIYIDGLQGTRSGQELMYFEFPVAQ